jgi:YidC/Oxa1 family membrane protein insertase
MTDIRRTLLWVVFTMSLVLLWDAWGRHHGQPSMFGPPSRAATSSAAPGSAATALPNASPASPAAVPAPAGAAASASPAAPPTASAGAQGEQVSLSTDVVKATFDTLGGTLVRLELLQFRDANDSKRNVLLFEQSPQHLYMAQTGLVSAQPGLNLPNHLSPMSVVAGERSLANGQQTLSIRFESTGNEAYKLAKTYTFKRGEYVVAVTHEFSNQSGTAVSPQLYLQLTRDGNPDGGAPSFFTPAATFTGPAVYTDANKFKKVEFKDIAKGAPDLHDKSADNGWVAMVQHYFASAWLVPAAGTREFRTAKTGENQFSVSMVLPFGEVAPGASKTQTAIVCWPTRRTQAGRAGARPGLGEGLRPAGRVVQTLVLVVDAAARVHGQLGLGHRGLGGVVEGGFLLAQRQCLPQHGQDESPGAQGGRAEGALQRQTPRDAAANDAHLQGRKGQPVGRLFAHLCADALFHRLVLGVVVQCRDAQRAVDRLDHRPLDQGPLVHLAAVDDGVFVVPSLAQPGAHRPHAGQADVDHAAGFWHHVFLLPSGAGVVLVDEQHFVHRAAVVHQQAIGCERQVVRAA